MKWTKLADKSWSTELCSRCSDDDDNQNHLFGNCNSLVQLYLKYNINNLEDVFENDDMEKLKQTVKFITEPRLDNNG